MGNGAERTVPEREHIVGYTDGAGRRISLFGRLFLPAEEGSFPAVVLTHGFNGRHSDFFAECKAFAEHGYLCYCYDLCGAQDGGASTGRTARDYTLLTMKEDLRAAIADVCGLPQADGRLFLFGGSQGGLVTALAAADEDLRDRVAGVALYFPAFNIPDDWRKSPVRDTPLMGYSVGAEYIKAIRGLDPFGLAGNYRGDVCIVWGDRDAVVPRSTIDRAVAAYGGRAALTVIGGAGHGFTGEAHAAAIGRVLAFFMAHTAH